MNLCRIFMSTCINCDGQFYALWTAQILPWVRHYNPHPCRWMEQLMAMEFISVQTLPHHLIIPGCIKVVNKKMRWVYTCICTAVLFIFNYLLFFKKNSKIREVDHFYYRYIYVYHHGTNIHLHTCIIQSCEMMRRLGNDVLYDCESY